MEIIQAIIYGVVQGLTEWLPISSTAHLRLVPALAGWRDPGAAFTAAIQLGTLLAIFVYFGRDLVNVFSGWLRGITDARRRTTNEYLMGWAILIGSVPIMALGFLFKDAIEHQLRSLYVVATSLIVMGCVLLAAERFGKPFRDLNHVKAADGLWVGLWQAIALIPGASRSGSTMSGALFAGFDRKTAARFSFLLSTPSVLAAGVYSMYRHRHEMMGEMLTPIIVANVFSFGVGLVSIAYFMNFIGRKSVTPFVIYRVALGIAVLGLLATGKIAPIDATQPPAKSHAITH